MAAVKVLFIINGFRPATKTGGSELVTHELEMMKGSRPSERCRVRWAASNSKQRCRRQQDAATFAYGFLLFVAAAAFKGSCAKAVFVLYLAAIVVAFLAHALDKSAAQNRWRTQERLASIRLLGGWPGALAAQRLFRHKSKKTSFQAVFFGLLFC